MTRANRIILAVFLGSLALFPAVVIAFDVWVYSTMPSGSTISWSMSLLGYDSPIAVFFVGFFAGSVPIGLAVHFWGGMISPADWAKMQALEARVAQLEASSSATSPARSV